eukprot:1287441-Alexandrium_andersonii.AAC.1
MECCWRMSAPTRQDWAALLWLARYLLRRPRAAYLSPGRAPGGRSGRMWTPTSPGASPPGGRLAGEYAYVACVR